MPILELEDISKKVAGRKVVLTSGVYDILHVGHLSYLSRAKDLAEILVVRVDTDEFTRNRKGPTRPIIPQYQRALMLDALKPVDYVVITDDMDACLNKIKPQYWVKVTRSNQKEREAMARDLEDKYPFTKIVFLDDCVDISTTSIINKIVRLYK